MDAWRTSSTICIGRIGLIAFPPDWTSRASRWPWKNRFAGSSVIADGCRGLQGRPYPDSTEGGDRSRTISEFFTSNMSARSLREFRRHSGAVSAPRTMSRHRKLHRRAGGSPPSRTGRLSQGAGSASRRAPKLVLDLAAEKAGWDSVPRERPWCLTAIRLGSWLALVAEVEVSKAGTVRVRVWLCDRLRTVINPTRCRRRSRAESSWRHRCSLRRDHAEGRPCRADQLRLPIRCAHERDATFEVHVVESTEPPGGMGETGTSAIVPAIAKRRLCRPRQAPAQRCRSIQPAEAGVSEYVFQGGFSR